MLNRTELTPPEALVCTMVLLAATDGITDREIGVMAGLGSNNSRVYALLRFGTFSPVCHPPPDCFNSVSYFNSVIRLD